MAEGFARAYGSDVMLAQSAGLAPAMAVAPTTHKVMLEKDIDVGALYPRKYDEVAGPFDLIINISGMPLPFQTNAKVEEWKIRDPIGQSEQVHRQVRDEIEQRVSKLITSLRSRKPAVSEGRAAPRVDSRGRGPRK